jgi:hypothetical protein
MLIISKMFGFRPTLPANTNRLWADFVLVESKATVRGTVAWDSHHRSTSIFIPQGTFS